MEQQPALEEIARLEARMGGNPGADAFPALAEANRRAGRAKEAERVARDGLRHRPDSVSGRVALSLALLDLGCVDEARTELRRVLEIVSDHPLADDDLGGIAARGLGSVEGLSASAEPLGDLADEELENAFMDAEAQPDEMLSANRVVAAAVRAVDQDEPEGVTPIGAESPFATETVAELLEQQDRGEEARVLRAALEPAAAFASLATGPGVSLTDAMNDRARVIATLERWLENLRRGSR